MAITTKETYLAFCAFILGMTGTDSFSTPVIVRSINHVPCARGISTEYQERQNAHAAQMLFSPVRKSSLFSTASQDNTDENERRGPFIFSAARASVRATTGFSLTAFRASLYALTVSATQLLKRLVGVLPPWARYFVQPFLVMYYTPLTILRAFVSSQEDAKASHEKLLDGWREAITSADEKIDSWPIHVSADGSINADVSETSIITNSIVEAIEMKYEEQATEAKHEERKGGISP